MGQNNCNYSPYGQRTLTSGQKTSEIWNLFLSRQNECRTSVSGIIRTEIQLFKHNMYTVYLKTTYATNGFCIRIMADHTFPSSSNVFSGRRVRWHNFASLIQFGLPTMRFLTFPYPKTHAERLPISDTAGDCESSRRCLKDHSSRGGFRKTIFEKWPKSMRLCIAKTRRYFEKKPTDSDNESD